MLFFRHLIEECSKSDSVIIISHTNSDLDALASAIGTKYILMKGLEELGGDAEKIAEKIDKISIIIPNLNRIANHIYKDEDLELSNYEIKRTWPEISQNDLLIIVDTNDIRLTDFPKDQIDDVEKLIIIDHHEYSEYKTMSGKIISKKIASDFTSNVEILINYFMMEEKVGNNLPLNLAKLFLAGIITDTANFKHSNEKTIGYIKYLTDRGIKLSEIYNKLTLKRTRAENIARLRAGMRIKQIITIDEWIIVFSHVSSFGASAAKSLIKTGASVAIIISFNDKHEFIVSSRANYDIMHATKFNLAKIMKETGEYFEGSGGGHRAAAGCYGKTTDVKNYDAIYKYCTKKMKEQLSN